MGSCCGRSRPSAAPEVHMTPKFKELESAHWVRKIRTLFRTLDTDCDGFITLEDNQASPKRMTEYFNLSKEKADAVLEYTRRVGWVEFVNAGVEPPEGHRISEQTFVENIARAVNSKEDVAKHLAECHIILFDLKEPGILSREEYLKVFRAQDVKEDISVKRFEMLDSDKDGRITVDDYTQDIRFFFTDLGEDGEEGEGPGDDRVVTDASTDDERNHPHRNNIFGDLIKN